MTEAVDELTHRFLGKLGVYLIGDAITVRGPTIIVWVRGALDAAHRHIPSEVFGIPVSLRQGEGIVAIYGVRSVGPGEHCTDSRKRWYNQPE
jgi:hypothetical protein